MYSLPDVRWIWQSVPQHKGSNFSYLVDCVWRNTKHHSRMKVCASPTSIGGLGNKSGPCPVKAPSGGLEFQCASAQGLETLRGRAPPLTARAERAAVGGLGSVLRTLLATSGPLVGGWSFSAHLLRGWKRSGGAPPPDGASRTSGGPGRRWRATPLLHPQTC